MPDTKDTLIKTKDTLTTIKQSSPTTTTTTTPDNKLTSTSLYILTALIIAVVTWILRSYYEKHIALRPRLVIKLGNPLYGQKIISYDVGHELTWRHQCVIKNNSQIPAYNIELWEITSKGRNPVIDNFPAVKIILPANNHLEKHEQKDINKVLKYDYLYPRNIQNQSHLISVLKNIAIPDYNNKRPHGSLDGLTPQEAYGKKKVNFKKIREKMKEAYIERVEFNRTHSCMGCPFGCNA